MYKKILAGIVAVMMIFSTIVPLQAINDDVTISAQNAIVIDEESGKILYERNAKERMYPASITKILTIICALEKVDDLDKTVTITQSDLDTVWETGASAANFEVGEVVTYRDVFMGAMLPSGADACRALANNTSGSQEAFVDDMNKLVEKLGLTDSHFVNTTGIHDDNHYTTVYDMAKITQYAMQNENFVELFNRYQYNASNGKHQWVKKVIYNAKRANIDTSMITGCKSGYTMKAQHTLASSLNINGHTYICVVGYSRNSDGYSHCTINDTLALGQYIGTHYQYVNLNKKGEKVQTVNVKDGEKESLDVMLEDDINAVLPVNYDQAKLKYDYHFEDLSAPVKKGDKVGTLKVSYDDDVLYETTFKATQSIDKQFSSKVKDTVFAIVPWIIGIIVGFIILLFIARSIFRKIRRNRRKKYNRYRRRY